MPPPTIPFKLHLSQTSTGYQARLSSDLTGEAREDVTLPPLRPIPDDRAGLRALGKELYDALFVGSMRSALDTVRSLAAIQQARIAARLSFEEDSVAAAQYPWELLYDGGEFLLLAGIDLTRYIAFPRAVVPITIQPPLRVLHLSAEPTNLAPIDMRSRTLAHTPAVEIESLNPPTYRNLLKRFIMEQAKPVHIFSFEGHGTIRDSQGCLWFEDEQREGHAINPDNLAIALRNQKVALAILYACHSAEVVGTTLFESLASTLIRAGVPAVVGIHGTISNEGAADFYSALYQGLSRCYPITNAVANARAFLHSSGEWFKPVLYLRSVDENGKIFIGCPGDQQELAVTFENVDPVELLKVLKDAFGSSDFRVLSFELGIDTANLVGDTLENKMLSLIQHHQHRNTYALLVQKILEQRPHLRERLLNI